MPSRSKRFEDVRRVQEIGNRASHHTAPSTSVNDRRRNIDSRCVQIRVKLQSRSPRSRLQRL